MQGQFLSLEVLLGRLSNHFDNMASKILSIEESFGKIKIEDKSEIDSSSIRELQSLDFIRQSLEDTAILLCILANKRNEHYGFGIDSEIHNRLRLESTRSLLLNTHEMSENAKSSSGAVDLF